MSQLSKKPIVIPAKTEVTISDANLVSVKGPLGALSRTFPSVVAIVKADVVVASHFFNPAGTA